MTDTRARPLIAVAMGDAAGIGPEITVQAMLDEALTEIASIIVLGSTQALRRAAGALHVDATIVAVDSVDEARASEADIYVLECDVEENPNFRWGESNRINGANAIAQVAKAVELAEAGLVDGMVIGPLNKEAMHRAGFQHADEIQYVGALAGVKVQTVVTWNGIYRSSVTGHVPLRAVPDMMTQERIVPVIRNLWDTMGMLGVENRTIGVAGLNPHAGEGGAFGDEEIEVIGPAIEVARTFGIRATGPHPADTIFVRALRGEFNGIAFMYHDQGNTPMKTAAFGEGTILYTGLPFPCAGVTHGSAYDIAGQGVADAGCLLDAIGMVAELCSSAALAR